MGSETGLAQRTPEEEPPGTRPAPGGSADAFDQSRPDVQAPACGVSAAEAKTDQARRAGAREHCVLVVDDDSEVAGSHSMLLNQLGYPSITQTSPCLVEAMLERQSEIELVLLDIRMPEINGLDLLRRIKLRKPHIGVIMATVINDIEEAVKATRLGAYNYLLKPLQPERLERIVSSYFSNQPRRLVKDPRFGVFVTQSPLCEEVFRRVSAFAQSEAPVLIQGETGTGKEVIARLLHAVSPRREKNFTAVNVAALSSHLFESELFGHRKGAFTGAIRDQKGYFAQAGDGTLFLDEIGELGAEQQKKLLRSLETRRYSAVGQSVETDLQARVILATNRDLLKEVRNDAFRKDLYYRFCSHCIEIPPLRQRPEDIELLARYFLERYCAQHGRSLSGFAAETLQILQNYPFPGNVRELDGLISAAVLLEQGAVLQPASLPDHVRSPRQDDPDDLEGIRMQAILRTLAECDGNQTRAAEKLGIARGSLNRILKEYRQRSTQARRE